MIPLGTTFTVPTSIPGPYKIIATDSSSDSAYANFTLIPLENISLQFGGISNDANASAMVLIIDSVQYTNSTLPSSFIWPAGSGHTITAANIISAGAGKQYSWSAWSDGGAETHIYPVPASNATITANYNVQWQQTFSNIGLFRGSNRKFRIIYRYWRAIFWNKPN